MRRIKYCFALALTICMLAHGAASAQNIEISVNGKAVANVHASLEAALTASGVSLDAVTSLEVKSGAWQDADWKWLFTNRGTLSNLATLRTAAGVSIAPMPGTVMGAEGPIFPPSLQVVEMAELGSIAKNAFIRCKQLKSIIMPKVTAIGLSAFEECSALERIEIPIVTGIGNQAFLNCTSLRSASFPSLNQELDYTFTGCENLEYVELPKLEKAPFKGFKGCKSLTTVYAPKVTSFLSVWAPYFENCASLRYLFVGAMDATKINVKKVHSSVPEERYIIPCGADGEPLSGEALANEYKRLKAIDDSYEDEDENIVGGPNDDLLCGWKLGATVYKVSVTSSDLTKGAARANLLYARAGEQVKVSMKAAEGYTVERVECTPSTVVVAASGEMSMPAEAVEVKVFFKSLSSTTPQSYSINGNAAKGVNLKTAIEASGVALGEVVSIAAQETGITASDWTWLRDNASSLVKLETFEAESAEDIPFGTAAVMPHLKVLSIRSGLKSVGEAAFKGCQNLEDVDLPTLQTIGKEAFRGCTKLSELALPELTTIGDEAFKGASIQQLEAPKLTSAGEGAFAESLIANCNFSEFSTVGKSAFEGCKKIKKVQLPKLGKVSGYAFIGCEAIVEVACNAATQIDEYAFTGCTALVSAAFPKVTYITKDAFEPTPDNKYAPINTFSKLCLGATPPMYGDSENIEKFGGGAPSKQLIIVGTDGTPLSGQPLEDARNQYEMASGGDKQTHTWRGWSLLEQYTLNFEVVKVDGKPNGQLTCSDGTRTFASGERVAAGAKVTFHATPDSKFQVKEWQVDGQPILPSSLIDPLKLEVVVDKDPKTVSVTFEASEKKFAITKLFTPADGSGGVVNGPKEAAEGEKVIFTASPKKGNKVKSISVSTNGTSPSAVPHSEEKTEGKYAFTMPGEAVTIAVEFTKLEEEFAIVVQYTPGDGSLGRLEVSKTKAKAGEAVVISALPSPKAQLKANSLTVIANDASKQAIKVTAVEENRYEFTMPSAGVSISAAFEMVEKTPVESLLLQQISVSPNPFSDFLTVRHCEAAQRLELITVSGDVLTTVEVKSRGELRIDTRGLAAGAYLLRAVSAEGYRTILVIRK